MSRYLLFALAFAVSSSCIGATGSEAVRKHFNIGGKIKLSEHTVRESVLQIVPIGTKLSDVVKKLSEHGLSHPNWPQNPAGNLACFPDRTPIVCQFRSPRKDEYINEPNWTTEFFFDENQKLKEVEVRCWHYSRKSKSEIKSQPERRE